MTIFGLRACDTCRKAETALSAAGKDVNFVDIRAEPLERSDFERFFNALGEALVNRRSTTWRGLSEEARAADPLALLTAHPTLMKRPVIEAGGTLTLGWDKATQAHYLG
ncbi:MAG: arsenate reductase [Rhodobacteraceae bacterium]|nr:arsenate reductase [Paracoccaceae bacterium]